jgi:hypothetical protein
MNKKPQDVLKEWMALVNDGDLEGLFALYDKNAVLIPTFSNRLLNTPQTIREYFERLCNREDLSIALHEKTLTTQPLDGGLHTLCGIYCWRFAIDGEMLNFEARFSYLLNLALPGPILLHHSSQIPRTL